MMLMELNDTMNNAAESFAKRKDDHIMFNLLLQEYGPESEQVQSHYLYNIYYPTLITKVKSYVRRYFNKFIMLASNRFGKGNDD